MPWCLVGGSCFLCVIKEKVRGKISLYMQLVLDTEVSLVCVFVNTFFLFASFFLFSFFLCDSPLVPTPPPPHPPTPWAFY